LTSRLSGAHSHPPAEKSSAGRLPHVERMAPQIVAVELDQVEGPHEHVRVVVALPDALKSWQSDTSNRVRRRTIPGQGRPDRGRDAKKSRTVSASVQAAALLSCRVQRKIFRRLRPARAAAGLPAEYKTRLECDARISRRFARGSPDCSGVAKRAVRATSPSVALSLSWLPDRRRGPLLRYKTRAKSSRPCRRRSAASRPS
jgi:hypothetical protein